MRIGQLLRGLTKVDMSSVKQDPDGPDARLVMLRRARQRQLDEMEKQALKQQIRATEMERRSRGFIGESPLRPSGRLVKRPVARQMFQAKGRL